MERQSSCVYLSEADSARPPVSSARRQYRLLRDLWAQDQADFNSSLLRDPIIQTFQPSQAIAFLLAKQRKIPFPSLSPKLLPSGSALCTQGCTENTLPLLSEMCQMALLWCLAGEEEAARKLIQWLASLSETPYLWCQEKELDEQEFFLSFSLLFRVLGNQEKADFFLKAARQPADPFFLKLAHQVPKLENIAEANDFSEDPYVGLKLFKTNDWMAAFTLSGASSSLGMLRLEDVEIIAFGPQSLPVGEMKGFGIRRIPDGNPFQGWTRCEALPEVWIEMKNEDSGRVDLKFVGLSPQEPIAIVFYAKAQSCQVGNAFYKPKSLQRFLGESNALILKGKKRSLKIESSARHKLQVIPLAGEGSFWNAEFLIAFEIHPVAASASFLFSEI